MRGLRALGADVDFLVPNRFEYGYGLTPEIVALAAATRAAPASSPSTTASPASTASPRPRARGIDVLITDHHLPGATLPAPALIVNPNQPGCAFPSKHLAGVGVMFYVMLAHARAAARARRVRDAAPSRTSPTLLDLVALGTVADVVRLDRNNRMLVAQGSQRIRAGRAQPGIAALFAVAGRDRARARRATTWASSPGRASTPPGRLADMTLGIGCLLADDRRVAALPLAHRARPAEPRAARRRGDDAGARRSPTLDARRRRRDGDACTLCLFRPELAPGRGRHRRRRGSRTATTGRRSCSRAASDGELKGSGRSIAGFHLRDALDLVSSARPA